MTTINGPYRDRRITRRQIEAARSKLLASIQKTSSCWLWIGQLRKDGYGVVEVVGLQLLAHRAVWLLLKGPVPRLLMHECDNPSCVRPHTKHVQGGTQKQNLQHAGHHGRQVFQRKPWLAPRGERNGKAILSEAIVRRIKHLSKAGLSGRKIAKRFRLGQSHVSQILRGHTWSHVDG